MLKWITAFLAVCGVAMAVYMTTQAGKEPQSPPPASQPSVNPFAHGIASSGMVEAASRNIAVAAPEGGVVTEVAVEVGQKIKSGDVLFRLDTRAIDADLVRAKAQLDQRRARLRMMEARPRKEEIEPARAAVERATSRLADAEDLLESLKQAAKDDAATASELRRRTFAVDIARAELVQAQRELDLILAGTWTEDLAVERAEVEAAQANVRAIELVRDRLTVRAPFDATVLKRNVEVGQFTAAAMGGGQSGGSTGSGMAGTIVIGNLDQLRIRARVDEEDAWGLRENAAAKARLRGTQTDLIELKMLRIEPLAEAKMDLTGNVGERVDTRVVEVIFDVVGTPPARLFPGQMLDVYIESQPAAGTPAPENDLAKPAEIR